MRLHGNAIRSAFEILQHYLKDSVDYEDIQEVNGGEISDLAAKASRKAGASMIFRCDGMHGNRLQVCD
jgi:hypothetical protein